MAERRLIENYGIHWFRRDLRIVQNPGLRFNFQKHGGRVLGLFCFDSKFLSREDFSHNRFAFFLNTLKSLQAEMQTAGGDLLVVDGLPSEIFPKLLHRLQRDGKPAPSLVSWNRDYEPFARGRDQKIEILLRELKIEIETFRDHLIFEPQEVLKDASRGEPYQVYSPFGRKWFSLMNSALRKDRLPDVKLLTQYHNRLQQRKLETIFKIKWTDLLGKAEAPFQDVREVFENENAKGVTIPIPPGGFQAAFDHLLEFRDKVKAYKEDRDFPSIRGTSRLSMYLKNGSLTTAQVLAVMNPPELDWKSESGLTQFTKEIAWREFYYSILYHHPRVENEAFLQQFKNIKWKNDKVHFQKWKEGRTGFPIIDAGMRELNTTGWMHNRVRMIVASFLTKDLLIDWRWGENYFMKMLLDGDLAPNNGGWQWAASTGCDPQPYFRIFNPWLQSKKFDPDGVYIKKFIPELKSAPAKALHDPEGNLESYGYVKPIVDHSQQRDLALALYKN